MTNARRALAALAALAVALSAPRLAAQTTGAVRDSASGRPLPGAVVLLLDSAGGTVARATTDAGGRYRLPDAAAARRVRVLRLGFRPRELSVGAAADVAMAPIPVLLGQVRVTAAASCPARKDRAAALALLDQVRAGLLAAVVAADERPARMTRLTFERHVDGDRVAEQVVRSEVGSSARSFRAARRGADFVRDGFLDAASGTYFAPDAETLIDEGFSAGYCFHLAPPDRARPNEVGLAFAAAERRGGRVAVDGRLWVDTAARALRDLEFRYDGLADAVTALRPGGRLSFRALPNGVTVIDRWALRLVSGTVATAARARTRLGDLPGDDRARLRVTEVGGELADATWPDGSAWAAPLGALRLRLTRRDGRPAAGTVIRLDSTDYAGTADSAGTLVIGRLLPGPYAASIVEPALERVGVTLPTALRFVAARDSVVEASLVVETAETFVERRCEADRGAHGTAWVLGRVVDADGRPVNGASWTIHDEHGQPLVEHGRTGRDGLFHWCSLKLGATVVVEARDGERRGRVTPVLGDRVTTFLLRVTEP